MSSSVEPANTCPRCGGTLQPDALGGKCAHCLLELGIAADSALITLPPGTLKDRNTPLDRGRFIAGTLLSDRYRIIGLLGRGGMGEVYKAEDLTLHQVVALKFLPEVLASDGSMIARFHREVRMARNVTHPNVCRVHDIGEAVAGRQVLHFLSMEYIDGEDLSALLRRIGHVPHSKGIELARQLCAGLAAAHVAGMVHRDLKPANVMLDARGRVRITDFGLFEFASEVSPSELSGTPAYMSPEQLQGSPATPASDIYALGLVLYEMFTGHYAFENEGGRPMPAQRPSIPPRPSTRMERLDPAIEAAILQCLSPNPEQRPRSAFDVAAVLPGADPLAAALAAGETPSPEMVAASGAKAGLGPLVASLLLAGILGVLVLTAFVFNPAAGRSEDLQISPEVLAYNARQLMSQVGFPEPPVDVAYGYTLADESLAWGTSPDDVQGFKAHLARERPGWVQFWYRESSEALIPTLLHPVGPLYVNAGFRVTNSDPPPASPLMRNVVVDSRGRLLELRILPAPNSTVNTALPDWSKFLALAGLDPSALSPVPAIHTDPTTADDRRAWTGAWPGEPAIPLRVEAASRQGQPIFFKLLGPWSDGQAARKSMGATVLTAITIVILAGGMVAGVLLARRNVRAGRGDRTGARNVMLFAFCAVMLGWLFGSTHNLDPRELNLYLSALGESLYWAAIIGVTYLALEPEARARWPQALVSWNRLLKGRWRDPLVGRDILIGIAFAAVLSVSRTASLLMDFSPPQLPEPDVLQAIHSNAQMVSFLFGITVNSVNVPLGLFLLFSLFRLLLRNQGLAALVLMLVINALVNLPNPEWSGVFVSTVFGLLWLVAVLRFGLLSGMALWFADRIFRAEIMIEPSGWYASRMYFLLAVLATLAIYAHTTSIRKPRGAAISRPSAL